MHRNYLKKKLLKQLKLFHCRFGVVSSAYSSGGALATEHILHLSIGLYSVLAYRASTLIAANRHDFQ